MWVKEESLVYVIFERLGIIPGRYITEQCKTINSMRPTSLVTNPAKSAKSSEGRQKSKSDSLEDTK